MPVTQLFILGLLLVTFSFAQEVRQIDLTGVPERSIFDAAASGKYMICGTDEGSASKAVRVSVQSVTPTDIHPKQQISVVLRVENYGGLPVVLPVSPVAVVQEEEDSIRYRVMLPLGAGVPSGAIRVGWLELYGSTSNPDTTMSLKPGEWITVRGDIIVRHWYSELQADAYSDLQLYVSSGGLASSGVQCVKQVQGASIPIRFEFGVASTNK